jgi:protein O-GlcNAc transferase
MAETDALLDQAIEHHRAGRLAEAGEIYRAVLAERPNDADAWYLLGVAAHQANEHERAIELAGRALALAPAQARCHTLLGANLMALQRLEEAEIAFRRAAEIENSSGAQHNLGALAEAFCDRGDALLSSGQTGEALTAYRQATGLQPASSRAWHAAGCAESSREEYAGAVDCFRRALELEPEWHEARHNLGRALFKLGQVEEALAMFRRATSRSDPELPLGAIALLVPGDPASDNRAVLEARATWAERFLHPRGATGTRRAGAAGRPLRVGYVSAFFAHRNWMKPVWALINRHDRGRFEIHLFSDAPVSRIRHGYRAHPQDRFHDSSGLSNSALAERVEAEGIDLLIDLNGYSAMERLPMIALHPAPVVAGWFNFYATTGISSYDYLIGDERVIPREEESCYCEKIVRAPGSYLTFEVTYPVPPVVDPPCLASGSVTFGSLAPLYKITGQAVGVWSGILQRVPGSSLLIRNRELGSEGARGFVRSLFEHHGVAPARLRLEGPAEHYQFLETYGAIDIALDTFPYNGGTTTTEAIWQGVPVVAFSGDRWVSRTSASILRAGGLGELVGESLEDYVETSVRLAQTPERLLDFRRNMRARLAASPVCDTATFARNMEKIFIDLVGWS